MKGKPNKLYDATAKIPSGLLNGNVNQYGDFDQCLGVESSSKSFRGQYCLARVMVSLPKPFKYLRFIRKHLLSLEAYRSRFEDPGHVVPKLSEINWAWCVPSSCSHKDFEIVLKKKLSELINDPAVLFEVEVRQNMCQIHEESIWYTAQWDNIGFFNAIAVFVLLIIFSLITPLNKILQKRKENTLALAETTFSRFMSSFSCTDNLKSILSVERSRGEIPCLDGIRCINTFMLLLSHKGLEVNYNPVMNRVELNSFLKSWVSVPSRASCLNTDAFLMLSGFLVSYSFIGRLQRGQKISILKEIAGRYFRFVPPMAALILFGTFILPHLGSGPQWPLLITFQSELCKKTWWRNFLMIHNWFGLKNICMTHTYYVGTDFELFVVSTFLIVLLYNRPKLLTVVVAALAALATAGSFFIVLTKFINSYVVFGVDVSKFYEICDYQYIVPPYRFTVYAIGILLGFVLRKLKDVKLSSNQILFGQVNAVLCLTITSWSSFSSQEYTPLTAACFAAFAPISWCLTFAWMIFAARMGHKNILINIAEWKYFKISSNLSYGIYLVQFAVFHYNIGRTRSSSYFDAFNTLLDLNEMFMIIAAAGLLTLFIEYPFCNLKKLLLDSDRKKALEVALKETALKR